MPRFALEIKNVSCSGNKVYDIGRKYYRAADAAEAIKKAPTVLAALTANKKIGLSSCKYSIIQVTWPFGATLFEVASDVDYMAGRSNLRIA
jgi:hypothetical protein